MSTVQESIGDVHRLHSKLERKTQVETTNMDATLQLHRDFHSEVATMKEGLEGFLVSHQQSYSAFSNKIGV